VPKFAIPRITDEQLARQEGEERRKGRRHVELIQKALATIEPGTGLLGDITQEEEEEEEEEEERPIVTQTRKRVQTNGVGYPPETNIYCLLRRGMVHRMHVSTPPRRSQGPLQSRLHVFGAAPVWATGARFPAALPLVPLVTSHRATR
jgi:hypothetical protein